MKRNKEVLSRQAALLPFTLSFLQAFCFVKGFFFQKAHKTPDALLLFDEAETGGSLRTQ